MPFDVKWSGVQKGEDILYPDKIPIVYMVHLELVKLFQTIYKFDRFYKIILRSLDFKYYLLKASCNHI